MKRQIHALPVLLIAAGCIDRTTDDVSSTQVALNGQLIGSGGPLTRKTFTQLPENSENMRQSDTAAYYNQVNIGADGTGGGTIASALSTLTSFKSHYGFGSADRTTIYYNRGDLGVGREMHCVDSMSTTGQVACYVNNFAAGDDNSEFTFGLSANIAFANLDASLPFATVAMVYRDHVAAANPDRVFFAVYNATGTLTLAAALDRHGISFANAFNLTKPNNPDPLFGSPGVNFNNHIPSNCIACHGGGYDSTTHSATGALFLPFDLDQFDYATTAGRTRSDQLTAFQRQNEIVRKVAARSGSLGTAVKNQLDLWYHNTIFQSDLTEVFESDFDSTVAPAGWATGSGYGIYQSVIRRSCRTCHVTNAFSFDTEAQFDSLSGAIATDLCTFQMPHSLQALRQFWFSTGPQDLQAYLRTVGTIAATAAATSLQSCGPGFAATLDPPQIQAALATML